MLNIKNLIETGIQDGKDQQKMLKILAENIECGHSKTDAFEKLYKEIYGNHLCDNFCKEMVNNMHNANGRGEKWTISETNEAARKVDIIFSTKEDDYTEYEFYTVMHMMYYDYSNVFGESNVNAEPVLYAKLADAYLADEDAPAGKLSSYFFFIKKSIEK